MEYGILTDTDLVALLKRSDAQSFEEIYSRHWRKLLLFSRTKLPQTEHPEDLVQDLFVMLWEQREKLAISNLSSYLHTSLKNAVINRYRVKLLHQQYALQAIEVPTFHEQTGQEVELNELVATFEKQLQGMPEKTVKIFRLSKIEYKSVKEISATLDVPERTVEYHIALAIRKLRHVLRDYLPALIFLTW
jgi:RNA polymerase sigma-70 factor (family 1)